MIYSVAIAIAITEIDSDNAYIEDSKAKTNCVSNVYLSNDNTELIKKYN